MINERNREQQKKEEQIKIAEAEFERRDNELSLRESSLRAKEREFMDRLKRQEAIETQITNERCSILQKIESVKTAKTDKSEKKEH